MLATRGADLDAPVPGEVRDSDERYVFSEGCRAVHATVYAGMVGSLHALVWAGADTDAANDTGHTPADAGLPVGRRRGARRGRGRAARRQRRPGA